MTSLSSAFSAADLDECELSDELGATILAKRQTVDQVSRSNHVRVSAV